MDVATLLARCRARAGLSQRDLAHRSGTSAAAICLLERGQRTPRLDTLARIVDAAGGVLELRITWPTAPLDPAANARDLEQVLGLADHLPHRADPELRAPVLRDLAAAPQRSPTRVTSVRELARP